jgi:glycine/D-amino acid oxidase-like deaminating enzyme
MTVSPHVVVIGAGTLGMCTAFSLVEQGAVMAPTRSVFSRKP